MTKSAEYSRRWRSVPANREKERAWQREYARKNRNKPSVLASWRKYVAKHRDKYNEYNRLYRKRHPEIMREWRILYAKDNPEKIKAHNALHLAIRQGIVVRSEYCQDCGLFCKTQGHHENYEKRLEVVWVCRFCHRKRHGEKNK